MKIDYVILSSDNNPLYIDFWPIVSKIWKEKFNITPILALIDNDDILLDKIDKTYGDVYKFDIIDDVPIYLQCLWIRYWITSKFKNSVCMISDIDMIPLSKYYFIDSISEIDNNDYVHLNPCYDSYGTLPSCYHIGKGSLLKEIWKLDDKWEDSIKRLNNLNLGRSPDNLVDKIKWFSDEKYSSDLIFEWRKTNINRVNFIKREDMRRIDRYYWSYDKELVKSGYYYDSHCVRPYTIYKSEIDKLINLL